VARLVVLGDLHGHHQHQVDHPYLEEEVARHQLATGLQQLVEHAVGHCWQQPAPSALIASQLQKSHALVQGQTFSTLEKKWLLPSQS